MLALSTVDLSAGLTPTDLAQAIVGSGVAVSNVSYSGALSAGGTFSGGVSENLGIESGVILGSGNIADAPRPNEDDATTTDYGNPGDADLDSLIPGFSTNDAAVLEFDFVAEGGTISFQYVFGSEEYNEWVNSDFNDVFGFFLDGTNIALIPATTTPVSINNINATTNSSFYRNNDPSDLGIPTPFATEADGFTAVLQASAVVSAGVHHIKLAIADAGDTALDSWVFIAGESFVSGEADLEITKADAPDPVQVGASLVYTLEVTNHGPDDATQVILQDDLPDDVTFLGVTPSQGTAGEAGGFVTANLGTIAAGATATVAIEVIPNAVGTLTNSATIIASQFDPGLANNSVSEETTVVDVITAEVEVDVMPGSDRNPINLTQRGVVPVTLFTTDTFDATTIDASTILFAGASVDHYAFEDVDGDGDLDAVLHFRVQETNLLNEYRDLVLADLADGTLDSDRHDFDVLLTGKTLNDQAFEGSDSVKLFLAGKALEEFLAEL